MNITKTFEQWREMPRIGGVYRVIHLPTGREYIGSSQDVRFRCGQHRRQLIAGTHHSPALEEAFEKDGRESLAFEILETVADEAERLAREQWYIDTQRPAFNNAQDSTCCLGVRHTPETCRKRSEASARNWQNRTPEERSELAAGASRRMRKWWKEATPEQREAHAARQRTRAAERIRQMTPEQLDVFTQTMSEAGKAGGAARINRMSAEEKATMMSGVLRGQKEWRQDDPAAVASMTERMTATKRAKYAKMSEQSVIEMRQLHASGGWTFDALAHHYKVSIGLAFGIVKRTKWKSLQ